MRQARLCAARVQIQIQIIISTIADWSSPDDPARFLAAEGRLKPSSHQKPRKGFKPCFPDTIVYSDICLSSASIRGALVLSV